MKFSKMYDAREVIENIVYPDSMAQFNEIILPDGTVKRTPADPLPLQDLIQSYEADCNLASIFERYQSGDLAVVNQRPGFYLDLSDCPADSFAAAEFLSEMVERLRQASADRAVAHDQSAAVHFENGKQEVKKDEE